MDVLALITLDHTHVKSMFEQLDGLDDDAKVPRTNLIKTILEQLTAHDRAEGKTLYAVLQKRLSGDDEREERLKVLQAAEEHALAEELIQKLESTDPLKEEFIAKFAVLRANVEHHINAEEEQVHPIARSTLEMSELNDLGERFQDAKKHAMA
jgi:hemerythrin-like domain-containing protein